MLKKYYIAATCDRNILFYTKYRNKIKYYLG